MVGQTSGQWVKPKNTRNGLPRKSLGRDGLAILIGELERPADRALLDDAGGADVLGQPQDAAEHEREAAEKGSQHQQNAVGRGVPWRYDYIADD